MNANTHGIRLTFGEHEGERITRVPARYLRWMVRKETDQADAALAELYRRGDCKPEIEVTGHAIDRASLLLLGSWRATARKNEGLRAWLARRADEAWRKGDRLPSGKIAYDRMKFVFDEDGLWPVLKTVMPRK